MINIKPKKILILVDNPKSWIIPYAEKLNLTLQSQNYISALINSTSEINAPADVMFILGCEKIIADKYLSNNKHNIVIHESALPHGKGWSPLTWQILEGKMNIPITLFEAAKHIDSGDIYFQEFIEFSGHELNNELKDKQGKKTIEMCERFLNQYNSFIPTPQKGNESFYKRRTPKDSELDINKTLLEQFNLLRVCDNERYPAFFYHKNRKYIIKIYDEEIN